jgi:hypothetical protein
MSIEKLIIAGHYESINKQINSKNFFSEKTSGKDTLKMRLVNFKDYMTSAEVKKYMKKNKMRPASLKELLSFGEQYHSFLRKHDDICVVALGSNMKAMTNEIVAGEDRLLTSGKVYLSSFVPYLSKNGFGQSELGMIEEINNNWSSNCYFLAFSCE